MTIDFLIKNLDLLDADHVEMACGVLRARHRQAMTQRDMFGWDEARVRADIAARPSVSHQKTTHSARLLTNQAGGGG